MKLHAIAQTIRNAYVMDEEETRLTEDIEETISELRNAGVGEEDCAKVRSLLETAIATKDNTEYIKCFDQVIDILMPYADELKSAWESICLRFNIERPFDASAVADLVEIYSDLELYFE